MDYSNYLDVQKLAERGYFYRTMEEIIAMGTVYISPAGLIGRALCRLLERQGVEVHGFVDQKGMGESLGKPIVPILKALKTEIPIVVAHDDLDVRNEIIWDFLKVKADGVVLLDNDGAEFLRDNEDLSVLNDWKRRNGLWGKLKELVSIIHRQRVPVVYIDYRFFPYDFTIWILFQNLQYELERLDVSQFDLVVIDDRSKPRRGDQGHLDDSNKTMLVQNMLFDGVSMIRGLRNFYYFRTRWSAARFYLANRFRAKIPLNYSPFYQLSGNSFSVYAYVTGLLHYNSYTQHRVLGDRKAVTAQYGPVTYALEQVEKWLDMQKIDPHKMVTVTIRNTIEERRNCNISQWAAAFKRIAEVFDVQVVVLPDYYDLYEVEQYHGFEPFATLSHEALLSIRFRQALYSKALLNVGADNGTGVFLWYTDNPMLLYKKTTVGFNYKANYVGFGEDFAHFSDYQKFVWEDDAEESVFENVSALLRQMGIGGR